MNQHPDRATLQAFRSHQLSGEQFVKIARHVSECAECGRQEGGGGEGKLLQALAARDAAEHLSDEEIDVLVDRQLARGDYAVLAAHAKTCPMCRAEVEDLLEFAAGGSASSVAAPAHASGNRWMMLAAAALIAMLMLAALAVALRRDRAPEPRVASRPSAPASTPAVSTPERSPSAPAATLALNDHARQLALLDDGTVKGIAFRSDADRELTRSALAGKALSIPAFVSAMPSALRSEEPAKKDALRVLAPVRTAVRDPRPRFSWSAVEGATSYRVLVFDAQYAQIAQSDALTATTWTPSAPLPAGVDLVWQVVAQTPAGEVSSAGASSVEPRLRVLASAEAVELERALRHYQDSSLVRGLLLARAGVVDEAESEFRRLARENPSSLVARRLLASLR